jgi:hypothetical protein
VLEFRSLKLTNLRFLCWAFRFLSGGKNFVGAVNLVGKQIAGDRHSLNDNQVSGALVFIAVAIFLLEGVGGSWHVGQLVVKEGARLESFAFRHGSAPEVLSVIGRCEA